jgi:2-oxoisovalerate dehydrogenase E1 component
MKGITIDGNNIVEVYQQIAEARAYCIREQKPILVECMTFRMRGHEEASGVKYVPKELFELWAKKDPLQNFEDFLVKKKIITSSDIESYRAAIQAEIEAGIAVGFSKTDTLVSTEAELADIYAPFDNQAIAPSTAQVSEKKMIQAISEALDQSMQRHPNLILMGQDIAAYGGAFKVSEGLMDTYGKERVRNTPLCESAIIGAALGLSIKGYKAMMEMQFADFVTVGFNQIINNLAKIHYRWGQNADVVVRMPTGAGVGAGPFHSQSNEAWFTHTPGLKVLYPSNPYDAKGLLNAAFNDPNPVLFFEHKVLYRSISAPVPDAYYTIEIGKAATVLSGDDISIISYGAGVHWVTAYAAAHPEVSIELLDLRSLLPLDYDAIRACVEKTGKVLIVHEDTLFGGIGGELSAWITEHCFKHLDAPVMRCASLDTPVPFAIPLEQNFLAKSRLEASIQKLLNY